MNTKLTLKNCGIAAQDVAARMGISSSRLSQLEKQGKDCPLYPEIAKTIYALMLERIIIIHGESLALQEEIKKMEAQK